MAKKFLKEVIRPTYIVVKSDLTDLQREEIEAHNQAVNRLLNYKKEQKEKELVNA